MNLILSTNYIIVKGKKFVSTAECQTKTLKVRVEEMHWLKTGANHYYDFQTKIVHSKGWLSAIVGISIPKPYLKGKIFLVKTHFSRRTESNSLFIDKFYPSLSFCPSYFD